MRISKADHEAARAAIVAGKSWKRLTAQTIGGSRTAVKLTINGDGTWTMVVPRFDFESDVERGETIVICRRNVPIAEIRPLPRPPTAERPVGIDRGMVVPKSFFEPLPDDLLDAFDGGEAS